MKTKLKLLSAAIVVVFVWNIVAQEYINRQPTPSETKRIAGLNFYPAAANDSQWNVLDPTTNYTLVFLNAASVGRSNSLSLGLSNYQNVILRSTGGGGATNFQVALPNPTNSQGHVYRVVGLGRTIFTLTNYTAAPGNTFYTVTNNAVTSVIGPTNSAAICFNPDGTNWIAVPYRLIF